MGERVGRDMKCEERRRQRNNGRNKLDFEIKRNKLDFTTKLNKIYQS